MIRSTDHTCDISARAVRNAIDNLNDYLDANATGIHLELTAVRVHDDDGLAWLPPCDSSGCGRAMNAMNLLRAIYSESSGQCLNLFFSCLRQNGYGGPSGVGTFPWSSSALYPGGGVWLNSTVIDFKPHLLPHEIGHVFGLWHIHRGVSEVSGCSDPCYERARDPGADRRGDFAADTPATPVNYTCFDPPFADCEQADFAPTRPDNLMGYGPPECARAFTPQQILRMQCWARSVYGGWLASTPNAAPLTLRIETRAIPNPAVHVIDFAFELPEGDDARIEIFDLLGRRVVRLPAGYLDPGSHRVRWSGEHDRGDPPRAGFYVLRISSKSRVGKAQFSWRP